MLHAAPQPWSYMDNSFAQPSSYLGPAHHSYHHHNPYTTTWQPHQATYASSTGAVAAAAASSLYSTQVVDVRSMPPPALPIDHDTRPHYPVNTTPMTASSPSTTSSTSVSSIIANWAPVHPQDAGGELPHVCAFRGCGRAYKRKAELDRHTQEKHGPTSGRLLCPVKMCPRGIPGEGFDRMSHLTQHLRSGKHKMTPSQAKFLAREHNPRKGGRNG